MQFAGMMLEQLEALRENLAQKEKRKGNATSFTLKRVKLVKPELVKAPPEQAPTVIKVTFEAIIAPPQVTLPPTFQIPRLFLPRILIEGTLKATPNLGPSACGRGNVFS